MDINPMLRHIPGNIPDSEKSLTEYIVPVLLNGIVRYSVSAHTMQEAAEKAMQGTAYAFRHADPPLSGIALKALLPEQGFVVPVFLTGTRRCCRIMATSAQEAAEKALSQVRREIRDEAIYSGLDLKPMCPELELTFKDRLSWPYWGYKYDGRFYKTDCGPESVPNIATESWPIPYFDSNGSNYDDELNS